jgi:predicted nucleotidyltransferase
MHSRSFSNQPVTQLDLTGRLRTAKQTLPDDFREFLRLLNDLEVEYLLIGGYAVGYYGYPRTTADMDIWVALSADNAGKITTVFDRFGMVSDQVSAALFMNPGNIVRMGLPPMRIEVLNQIDGVQFDDCFEKRTDAVIDGVPVKLISLPDLKANKLASGRHKDLDDLEHLPNSDV